MRTVMREQALKEEQTIRLSERNDRADQLLEKWSKRPGMFGDKMVEAAGESKANLTRMRNLSIILENQEGALQRMTETTISNTFQTTPENVMRIVRLGYPNSVKGEIFLDWAMETARDSIYYLSPVYTAAKRGSVDEAVTHESAAYRFASEIEVETIGTGDDSTVAFTLTVANPPIRPWAIKIFVANEQVAADDGSGGLSGSILASASTNTINYTTGAIVLTFTDAPTTGEAITVEYHFDSENSDQYTDIGSVDLQLRDYQFRAKPWPLFVSWSKMTELLLGTTLNIDAEEALIRGAADELKKSLDFYALRMGYQAALKNSTVTFDGTQAAGESEIDRAQAFTRSIDQAGDVMFAALQRGGVTKLYGGPGAISYIKLHRRFSDAGKQPTVGAHKIGSLDGIDIYKVPTAIVPNNELIAVYRNEEVPEDVAIAFGTLVPLYQTQSLEFKEMYTETGMAFFGDAKVLQSQYLIKISLTNI